jgi:EAL domain-containing protein (putative c-di-GMP-specific phosphodiesterase class I)
MNPNVFSTIAQLRGRTAPGSPGVSGVPPADGRTTDVRGGPPPQRVVPVQPSELLDAIAHDHLVLHLQPIVDLRTARTVEVEALVRWEHPERGLLAPGTFVPQAERTGEVVALGRWVLDAGCRQLRSWLDAGLAPDLVLAVNVSPRQLDEPSLVDDVLAALDRYGLPASSLMLEITEGLPVRQGSGALGRIGELRRQGLGIAVDDFGTGHSWIGSVRRFGIDVLKVDRSFVAQVGQPGGESLMAALIDLGKAVGARVVAEGIESEEQLDLLCELDCDLGQGYFLARPMPEADLARRLRDEMGPLRLVTRAG